MATKLNSGNFSAMQLQQLVARIERLHAERDALSQDVAEVYAEAKAHGFDTKIMRQAIKLRKMDKADLQEQSELLDIYMHALGMASDDEGGQSHTAQSGAGSAAGASRGPAADASRVRAREEKPSAQVVDLAAAREQVSQAVGGDGAAQAGAPIAAAAPDQELEAI